MYDKTAQLCARIFRFMKDLSARGYRYMRIYLNICFFIFQDKLQIFFLTLISRTKGNENRYLYIHTDMLKFIHAVNSMVTPIS